ncbi:MAG TPA: Asp-tRNA(Asn)/Glu-tRNA(Gln) amidotransferase subunit GatC [Alphaproteobacteria bacterium]
MALDRATVARVARLARIRIGEDELDRLAGELDNILNWIEQLNEVDVAGVEPMTSVVAFELPERADRVTEGGRAEDIVANAPETAGSYFVVPKVVE